MKRYEKTIDGKTVRKTLREIVVKKDGKVTYNPSEEMALVDGWVEYVAPIPAEPSEEQLLEEAKERALQRLKEHDEGEEVNDCIIVYQGQEFHFWKDKMERDALKGTLRDHIALGIEDFRLDLREHGISITVNCELLLGMMAQLEVYATRCFNNTTDHEFAIKAFTDIDNVEGYEFRHVGYPEIPRFEV